MLILTIPSILTGGGGFRFLCGRNKLGARVLTCLFTLLDKPRSVSSGSVASDPVQFGQDIFVSIAQMAEQRIFNPLGAGSIPAACTKTEE